MQNKFYVQKPSNKSTKRSPMAMSHCPFSLSLPLTTRRTFAVRPLTAAYPLVICAMFSEILCRGGLSCSLSSSTTYTSSTISAFNCISTKLSATRITSSIEAWCLRRPRSVKGSPPAIEFSYAWVGLQALPAHGGWNVSLPQKYSGSRKVHF